MSAPRLMGVLHGDGTLTDVRRYQPDEQGDPRLVPLTRHPDQPGVHGYDPDTQTAVLRERRLSSLQALALALDRITRGQSVPADALAVIRQVARRATQK